MEKMIKELNSNQPINQAQLFKDTLWLESESHRMFLNTKKTTDSIQMLDQKPANTSFQYLGNGKLELRNDSLFFAPREVKMLEKLAGIHARFKDIETLLGSPEVVNDREKFTQLNKEYRSLEKISVAYLEYKKCKEGYDGAQTSAG